MKGTGQNFYDYPEVNKLVTADYVELMQPIYLSNELRTFEPVQIVAKLKGYNPNPPFNKFKEQINIKNMKK